MAIYPTGAGLSIALRATNSVKSAAEWSRGIETFNIDDLLFLSNSVWPSPQLDSAAVHVYSAEQGAANYAGAPKRVFQLARTDVSGGGDRGHALSVCPDGTLIISTTERVGDPDNSTEAFYIVPPGLSGELTESQVRRITSAEIFGADIGGGHGARFVAQFGDGTVLLGRSYFVRVPRSVLLDFDSDLSGYPATRWQVTGAHGESINYDCVVDPRNPNYVWIEGNDQTWCADFSGAPGVRNAVRMFRGSNVGDGPNGDAGWPGHIDFGPDNYLWKVRSFRSDLVAFSPAQQDAAPDAIDLPNGNPTPARVLQSPVFETIDTDVEGLYGIVFDALGRCTVSTFRWSLGAPAQTMPSRAWRFSAAAMAEGGTQMPEWELTNLMHAPASVRHAPGRGLRLR